MIDTDGNYNKSVLQKNYNKSNSKKKKKKAVIEVLLVAPINILRHPPSKDNSLKFKQLEKKKKVAYLQKGWYARFLILRCFDSCGALCTYSFYELQVNGTDMWWMESFVKPFLTPK